MFDFAPTILDYAGTALPEGMAARSLRGEIETGAGGRDCVFGEHVDNSQTWGGVYCRTGTHKLVVWSSDDDAGGELYCLEEDPLERVNRYADPALRAVRDELQARIIERGVTARG
jgi:arylsulfatase A-like enzyme